MHNVVNGNGSHRRPSMIQHLILCGANTLQEDTQGNTPEQCAKLYAPIDRPGQTNLIAILEKVRITRECYLAFSMGIHPTIGRDSVVNGLYSETIDNILSLTIND